MKALLFTPMASPFLEQPYKLLAGMNPSIDVVPVFYGSADQRKTWGKLTWTGFQLEGTWYSKFRQIEAIWKEVNPDWVILSQYLGFITCFVRAKALRNKVPFYFAFLDPFQPCGPIRSIFRKVLFRFSLHKASGLGVMGKTPHQLCARLFNGPIVDTPYTFDYSGMLAFDDSLRPKHKTVFLYSGRLVPFRDPLGTLRAFAKLHESYGDKVELILSGKGELEQACLSLIRELKIESAVRWMNDFQDWQDLRNLYRHAHVLLSLGKYSTWNLTIGEAMAAGMGVVATRSTEAANTLITPAYNGFLVQHGDQQDTVQQMAKYVENPELISEHASRSKEIIKTIGLNEVSANLARLFTPNP